MNFYCIEKKKRKEKKNHGRCGGIPIRSTVLSPVPFTVVEKSPRVFAYEHFRYRNCYGKIFLQFFSPDNYSFYVLFLVNNRIVLFPQRTRVQWLQFIGKFLEQRREDRKAREIVNKIQRPENIRCERKHTERRSRFCSKFSRLKRNENEAKTKRTPANERWIPLCFL